MELREEKRTDAGLCDRMKVTTERWTGSKVGRGGPVVLQCMYAFARKENESSC